MSYSTRYARPRPITDDCDDEPTEIDDLFALGTVIYEIHAGHQLYAEKSSREIWKLLRQGQFPTTVPAGDNARTVIRKCWAGEYHSAEEVLRDLNNKNDNDNTATTSTHLAFLLSFTATGSLFCGNCVVHAGHDQEKDLKPYAVSLSPTLIEGTISSRCATCSN